MEPVFTTDKRILIAPDKFKGSLSATEVCQAIANGIHRVWPEAILEWAPLADGGDGSVAILAKILNLTEVTIPVRNPLGHQIKASYYRSEDTAFVEMAAASGLVLLPVEERNLWQSSTYGTGQFIRHAIESGLENVFVFLGGSATNDGGMGAAEALGFQFLDRNGQALQASAANLCNVNHILPPLGGFPASVRIECLCDVLNPLLGPNGASYVYGPQKGAAPETVKALEEGMQHYAVQLERYAGKRVDDVPGSGAAGGLSAGLIAFCNAEIKSGMDAIQNWTKLEEKIQRADLVITGEGKLDQQTLEGKVVSGVLKLANQYRKPALLVVGKNELMEDIPDISSQPDILAVMDLASDESEAMADAAVIIENLLTRHLAVQ